jgi:hypothetical protein
MRMARRKLSSNLARIGSADSEKPPVGGFFLVAAGVMEKEPVFFCCVCTE